MKTQEKPDTLCGKSPKVKLDPEAKQVSLSFEFTGPIFVKYLYCLYESDGETKVEEDEGTHNDAGKPHLLRDPAAVQIGRLLEVTIHYWPITKADIGKDYSLTLEIHQKGGKPPIITLKKTGKIEADKNVCSDVVTFV